MFNNLQKITLAASLKEFWIFNKTYLILLPILIIVLYIVNLLLPSNLLYISLVQPELLQQEDYLLQLIDRGFGEHRILLFLIQYIIVAICTHSYLKRIKKQSRYTTMPITDSYRIASLWFYAITTILVGCLTLYIMDHSTVMLFKHYYLERSLQVNQELGILYPIDSRTSYFSVLRNESYLATLLSVFLLLPLLHLAHFLFKKRSILYSALLYLLILSSSAYIYAEFIGNKYLTVPLPDLGFIKPLILLVIVSTYILAFKHALREREI